VANTQKPRLDVTRVLITGANGFLGQNLRLFLAEKPGVQVSLFTRQHNTSDLELLLEDVDLVFHLAGVNRPQDLAEFQTGNTDLTTALAAAVDQEIQRSGKQIRLVYTSSTQAVLDNPYGRSKRQAEEVLFGLAQTAGVSVFVCRLPNVFGKWCRPNFNSVVATFCHNITRGKPIQVNDPSAVLNLVYVDDVLALWDKVLEGTVEPPVAGGFLAVEPQYQTTVGALARQLQGFYDSRLDLTTDRVGIGLTRALYATYVSYLPVEAFAYNVPQHHDPRGVFVEMLKTPDAGQFSFFTAHPGVTRGGHYHDSKTEKFLVIKGKALFRFRHMQTGQVHELNTSGEQAQVVETVPGWTHDITNIGTDELVVMLWANEVFDHQRPDTYRCPV
jgi:UDP-2-acetamido-2,6-beta-L-arabino-hexul-4-ose reductase